MRKPNFGRIKHIKLFTFAMLTALLIAGYFVYKYTYIYLERRKYDQAAVAIQKVAADLRVQGIVTEFSRGCSNNIEVYGAGSLSCSVGLKFTAKDALASDNMKHFTDKITTTNFKIINNGIKPGENGNITTGISTYTLKNSNLICNLQYDNNIPEDSTYYISFDCAAPSKFNIF